MEFRSGFQHSSGCSSYRTSRTDVGNPTSVNSALENAENRLIGVASDDCSKLVRDLDNDRKLTKKEAQGLLY